jgi:hypothetical protein
MRFAALGMLMMKWAKADSNKNAETKMPNGNRNISS